MSKRVPNPMVNIEESLVEQIEELEEEVSELGFKIRAYELHFRAINGLLQNHIKANKKMVQVNKVTYWLTSLTNTLDDKVEVAEPKKSTKVSRTQALIDAQTESSRLKDGIRSAIGARMGSAEDPADNLNSLVADLVKLVDGDRAK